MRKRLGSGSCSALSMYHNHAMTKFSWLQVDTPGRMLGALTTLKPHPSQSEWLLAKAPRMACWNDTEGTDDICASDLFLSKVGCDMTDAMKDKNVKKCSITRCPWSAADCNSCLGVWHKESTYQSVLCRQAPTARGAVCVWVSVLSLVEFLKTSMYLSHFCELPDVCATNPSLLS